MDEDVGKVAKAIYISGAMAGNASHEVAEKEWEEGDAVSLDDYYTEAKAAIQAMKELGYHKPEIARRRFVYEDAWLP